MLDGSGQVLINRKEDWFAIDREHALASFDASTGGFLRWRVPDDANGLVLTVVDFDPAEQGATRLSVHDGVDVYGYRLHAIPL